jgi:hypothetical protein
MRRFAAPAPVIQGPMVCIPKCRWLHEMSKLLPFDYISQNDIGQLDDKRPKPGIFLDERHPFGVLNLIPSRILANRRRAGALLPIGRWIRIPHN